MTELAPELFTAFHQLDGVQSINGDDLVEVYLNGMWRPSLTVTGVDGLPPTSKAGNVIRAKTTVKVSIRLPPNVDSAKAKQVVLEKLSAPAPYGAHVTLTNWNTGNGYAAKDLPEWL